MLVAAYYDREADIAWIPTRSTPPPEPADVAEQPWGRIVQCTDGSVAGIEIRDASSRIPRPILDALPEPKAREGLPEVGDRTGSQSGSRALEHAAGAPAPATPYTVRIPADVADAWRRRAADAGVSQTDAVTAAVQAFMDMDIDEFTASVIDAKRRRRNGT